MGGILPLLEAFVAFALTMAALTTVVSALVGTWHRLTRARAYGLRLQMVYFYRTELMPLLGRAGTPPAPGQDDYVDPLARFLVDTTLLPQVVDFREGEGDAAADPRVAMLRNGLKRSLWLVTGVEGGTAKPFAPVERFYRWRSLRFALESLPTEEFKVRLTASGVGRELVQRLGGDAAYAAELATLTRRFEAVGNAASEAFRRKAHVASYVAGALLAFGANIDSLNLLSAYQSRPELARQLVAGYERDGALPGVQADRASAATLLPRSARLDEVRERLRTAVDDPRLGQVDAQLQGELRTRLGEIDASLREVRASAVDATALVIGASQAFPVGWTLYPNCAGLGADPRCLPLLRAGKPESWWDTARLDRAGFFRWLVGVLLTAVLLGLGTPFWVQVINGALYARNLLRGPNSSGTGAPVDGARRTGAEPPSPQALRVLPS